MPRALAGDSVGGNMTAAVTLLAKERKTPEIRYQVLFYPVTDANFDTASYHEFVDGPWLTRPAMVRFWDAYAPKVSDRKKITASPLQATTEQLAGLPPALIIVDENDVLREAYARKLIAAGVEVTTLRGPGDVPRFRDAESSRRRAGDEGRDSPCCAEAQRRAKLCSRKEHHSLVLNDAPGNWRLYLQSDNARS
jgi:acetyl esterase/lipase